MSKDTQVYVRGSLVAVLLLAGVIAGCSTPPTPREVQIAKEARVQAEKTLMLYERAIADDKPDDAIALLSPNLPAMDTTKYRSEIKRVVILEHYDGYKLYVVQALDQVGIRHWLRGYIDVDIDATNKYGVRFRERFGMEKQDAKWLITHLELEDAIEGEPVQLPRESRDEIRAFLDKLVLWLKDKHNGKILYAFPEETRIRIVKPGFWSRLMGADAYAVSLAEDLMIIDQFDFVEWPKVPDRLPLQFITDKDVSVDLVGRYRRRGTATAEVLPIIFTVTFSEKNEKWEPYKLLIQCDDLDE